MTKWSEAKFNGDFVIIETYSGKGRTGQDPDGATFVLPPDAPASTLGEAVIESLAKSRILTSSEAAQFFDLEASTRRYESWVRNLMDQFNYRTKTALFKSMIACNIKTEESEIVFSPTRHERLEGWGRDKDDGLEDTRIPFDSSAIKIGASLRATFERCS